MVYYTDTKMIKESAVGEWKIEACVRECVVIE